MSDSTLSELQKAAEELRENIKDVDENIKKLTGRDPAESRRLSAGRGRVPLKRGTFVRDNQEPAAKRLGEQRERRRFGVGGFSSVTAGSEKLDGGKQDDEEERQPTIHSVVTGKAVVTLPEEIPKPKEDRQMRSRNRRMFGLLMGTLKQFKKESEVKTENESKREELLHKVEVQQVKEREDAISERRQLYQTRRDKQQELRKLEDKMEMAELKLELKEHYDKFHDFIRLKSTPCVYYQPASHNKKTLRLLEESRKDAEAAFKQRMCDIDEEMETDRAPHRTGSVNKGLGKRVPLPVNESLQSRDLFAEDADEEKRDNKENEIAVSKGVGKESEKTGKKGTKENGTKVVASKFKVENEEDDVERALKHTNTDKFEFQEDYSVADERDPAEGNAPSEGDFPAKDSAVVEVEAEKKDVTDITEETVSGDKVKDSVESVTKENLSSTETESKSKTKMDSEMSEISSEKPQETVSESNVVSPSAEMQDGEIKEKSFEDAVDEPMAVDKSETVIDAENNNAPVTSNDPVVISGTVGMEMSEKDAEAEDEISAMIEKFVEGETVF